MDGFIKYLRSEEAQHLHCNKNANHLLNVIAYRASRNGNPVKKVKPGEALIGDFKSIGLTRQEYRTAVDNLTKWGYITTKTTNAGTIARLCNSKVYDINSKAFNQENNQQTTIEQPSSNHQTTTIKNERKKERNKKKNIADRNDSNGNHYDKRQAFQAIVNFYGDGSDKLDNINKEFQHYNGFLLTTEFIQEHLSAFFVMFDKYKYYNDQAVVDALQKHLLSRYTHSDKKASQSLLNQVDYKAYLADFFDNHHKDTKSGSDYYLGALKRDVNKWRWPNGHLQYRLDVFELIRPHLVKLHKEKFSKYKNLTIFTLLDVLLDKVVTIYPVDKNLVEYYETITYEDFAADNRWGEFLVFLKNQSEYNVNKKHIRRLLQDEKDKRDL